MNLRTEIAFVVAFAGNIACGVDCPHTVVDRSSTVAVDSATACSLGQQQNGFTGTVANAAACQQACGDSAINECFLPLSYVQQITFGDAGVVCPPPPDGGATIALTCEVTHTEGMMSSGCPVEGRRPDALGRKGAWASSSTLGAYFAECAFLEAAAVLAFERIAAELRHHGAPRPLIDAAERAMHDEERHARDVGALAASFGATPARPVLERAAVRSLFEIARENVVEGVVRETYGAALAAFRAAHAGDAAVREVEASLVSDETSHAELSWALDAWARSLLSERENRLLDEARDEAVRDLRAALAEAPAAVLVARAGVPAPLAALAMLDALEERVWSRAA